MTEDAFPKTIERAYRVRLRPTPAQASTMRRIFGARRFAWNWALREQAAARSAGEKRPNAIDLSRRFTALRTAPGTAWLSDLPREPFSQTLRDLESAWGRFFKGQNRRPTKKRFGTVNSARFTLDQRRAQVDREAGRVQIDGVGKLRFRVTEPLLGRLRSVTVSCDAAGRWFASFTADQAPAAMSRPAARLAIGVDLGLKSTAVLSDGTRFAAPKRLTSKLRRLRRYQRSYVRGRDAQLIAMGLDPRKRIPKGTKIPQSNRMRRRQQQIGRLHAQIADARRDHQHQLTSRIVASAQIIGIEDLAVKAMGRSMHRGFRRSVADAGLGEVRRQLTYKASWQGRIISAVDRFYPSSKTCSACGSIKQDLTLRDRRWRCAACGAEHDRDSNAAVNIEQEALRRLQNPGESPATSRSEERNARRADTCAIDSAPSIGLPTAMKRALSYRGASRTRVKTEHDVRPMAREG